MKKNGFRRILSGLLCLVMLLSLLPVGSAWAVEAGDSYAPDASH